MLFGFRVLNQQDPFRYYDDWGNAFLFDSHNEALVFRRLRVINYLSSGIFI